ncbi:MAG: polysaccharide pyruvyl transferase family protein [Desulfobacteraceae bacterium]|nr:polysaccharide pyruvyl transferase family protein [Desulfobacteraceae bacterium]
MALKIKSYANFDLIIACGGGYLLQPGKLPKLDRWLRIHDTLLFAYDFYLAKAFNKPYILYNQSIGPFFRRSDFMAYIRFMRDAKVVLCRESLTYERLKEVGVSNIKQVADIAFHLAPKHSNLLTKYTKKMDGTKIGLTVRKWLDSNRQDFYENALAEFIRNVLSQDDKAQFYFMPQVHYPVGDDDDSIVSLRIRDKLPTNLSKSVHLITEDLHPAELKYTIGQMDYFVGTRMHSNIFALSMGIKTIAIAYEPKTVGIMKDLGLSRYVIPMEESDGDNLLSLFNELHEDVNYLSVLSTNLEYIKQLAFCDLKVFAT